VVFDVLLLHLPLEAQSSSAQFKNNQVYLELGGCGYTYTINYERFVTDNFTLRGGIGITPGWWFVDGTFIAIPVTGSYLVGSGFSKLELGLGATYMSVRDLKAFGFSLGSSSLIVIDGIIGYRGGRPNGGFIFRIAFNPMFSPKSDPEFIPYGLISFGFGF